MKNIFVLLIAAIAFQGCDKDGPGDSYDLSNPIAPYVTITNAADIELYQGEEASVGFSMRTAFQEKVTVHYQVTGAVNLTDQTAVIERNKLSVTVAIPIPDDVITTPGTPEEAVLTLTKAVTEAGRELTIGQKNDAENQFVNIIIMD